MSVAPGGCTTTAWGWIVLATGVSLGPPEGIEPSARPPDPSTLLTSPHAVLRMSRAGDLRTPEAGSDPSPDVLRRASEALRTPCALGSDGSKPAVLGPFHARTPRRQPSA